MQKGLSIVSRERGKKATFDNESQFCAKLDLLLMQNERLLPSFEFVEAASSGVCA